MKASLFFKMCRFEIFWQKIAHFLPKFKAFKKKLKELSVKLKEFSKKLKILPARFGFACVKPKMVGGNACGTHKNQKALNKSCFV